MCRVLKISRSTYYYKPVKKENTDILEQTIKNIFKDSRNNYGTRKIKIELSKLKYIVSRRKISRIMKKSGLVSSYTKASYKPVNMKIPENETGNLLNRKFIGLDPHYYILAFLILFSFFLLCFSYFFEFLLIKIKSGLPKPDFK